MTTPAQYEAAIQALEERIATLNRLIPIYTPHMYADVVVGMKAELAGLESALAIVREAREQDAARRRVEVWNATGLEDDDAR